MTGGGDAAPPWLTGGDLTPTTRKARYGVMWVRALAAQGGWASSETSADEDQHAVDLMLECPEGPVHVQVKCGTSRLTKYGIRQAVKPVWIEHWNRKLAPVYMVYVKVPKEPFDWIDYKGTGTLHRGHAYWVRVDGQVTGPSVTVPRNNRLTADTLSGWRDDLLDGYLMKGAL
jgi:hypothetical protein